MAKSSTDSVITTVGEWYEKLPNLPKDARELIVKITPWVALIFGVLGVLAGIGGLGVFSAFSPLVMAGGGASAVGSGIISSVLLLVSSVLLLAAFAGTKARKLQGWKFLFWSEVVSIVAAVLSISIFGVLFGLIGLYLIFQIKSYYK